MKSMARSGYGTATRQLAVAAYIALLYGCTSMTPQYQPDFEMVNTLKDIPLAPMQVGEFTSASPELDKVSIRGSSLDSPFGGSYSAYLRNAVAEELKQASLWDSNSKIIIKGELLENELDASGLSIGEANLSARFRVDKNGKQVYDKVHTVHHEWDSSFFGNIAIPNAINNYPIAVQKLVNEFLLDIDLLHAVQK